MINKTTTARRLLLLYSYTEVLCVQLVAFLHNVVRSSTAAFLLYKFCCPVVCVQGTKYCKRKPRKTSNTTSKTPSSSASAGGGASATGTASSPSGGALALGGAGASGGRKSGVVKARLTAPKKTKREAGAAARVLASNGAVRGGIPPAGAAGALAHPEREMAATTPAAVALDVSSSQQLQHQVQHQQMRCRGQEAGGDGGRGVKANFGGAIDGLGSRRSSFGSGLIATDTDRRHGLDPDACSGNLLPFYFSPYDNECGGGGAGRGDDSSWEDASMSGGAAAEDGPGGRNTEHATRMMATRRGSLEEALYESASYKRSNFLGGVSDRIWQMLYLPSATIYDGVCRKL